MSSTGHRPQATAPTTDKRHGFSLDDDLMPIVRGEVPLPNLEDLENQALAIGNIAATGHSMKPVWGHAVLPGETHKRWAFYFLTPVPTNRGGGYDGGGYVMFYGGWPDHGRIVRFAICKHEMQGTGTREQSQRGWNPGYCRKCGMDMSVDSSD